MSDCFAVIYFFKDAIVQIVANSIYRELIINDANDLFTWGLSAFVFFRGFLYKKGNKKCKFTKEIYFSWKSRKTNYVLFGPAATW